MKCRKCSRPALFRSRGKKGNRRLHGDKKHDLCQRCYRDQQNSTRRKPAKVPQFQPLEVLMRGPSNGTRGGE